MRQTLAATTLTLLLAAAPSLAEEYDPLEVSEAKPEVLDLTVEDSKRKRSLPIRIFLPKVEGESVTAAPVVLFSHGLGGSREGCAYLGEHWAKRGFVGVFLQHPGSDEAVWKDVPVAKRMAAMQRAANGQNLRLRAEDVSAVLDQLTTWSDAEAHPLKGRLDLDKVALTGHSFGAQTTQAVAGQRFLGRAMFADDRIDAAIAYSPARPQLGEAGRAFGSIEIPFLCMTGTKDTAPVGSATIEDRLGVFPALPAGKKYELVLHDGEHHAFADGAVRPGQGVRNPNHHKLILALSTAFLEAHIRGDEAALAWLHGEGAKALLEPKDRWQRG